MDTATRESVEGIFANAEALGRRQLLEGEVYRLLQLAGIETPRFSLRYRDEVVPARRSPSPGGLLHAIEQFGLADRLLRNVVARVDDGEADLPELLVEIRSEFAVDEGPVVGRVRVTVILDRKDVLVARRIPGDDHTPPDDGLLSGPAMRHGKDVDPSGREDAVEGRGGAVTVNFYDKDNNALDHRFIEQQANEAGISLRTGCFCNPGAGEIALGISRVELDVCFTQPGHQDRLTVDDFRHCIDFSGIDWDCTMNLDLCQLSWIDIYRKHIQCAASLRQLNCRHPQTAHPKHRHAFAGFQPAFTKRMKRGSRSTH